MINVYGIYSGDVLLYLGTTSRTPQVRWKEHERDLRLGQHHNKTLQKEYNAATVRDDGSRFDYRLIDSIDTDNSLLKYFYEGLYNSLLKPKCCKIVIEQGKRNRVVLQRVSPEIARELIRCIDDMCE